MRLTESDAALRWCPMVRVARCGDSPNVLASVNTEPHTADERRTDAGLCCIGSRCMMWRWAEMPTAASVAHTRRGYCGLAGAQAPNFV